MKRSSLWFGLLALAATAAVLPMACSSGSPPSAQAFKVESRTQLVGGHRALADVGDFKLTNGIIQVIVQDIGHSRGFGAFGGSLIDIDLVRGSSTRPSEGPAGNDQFTELFPAFLLEAMEPTKVEIVADGKQGGPAIVRVTGEGGEFLSMAKTVNDLVLTAPLQYRVDYILEPGKQYVKAEVTVTNPETNGPAQFPIEVPTGFITMLGAGQKLFVPGLAGYDMRFRLDEVYAKKAAVDALPGEVATMVATEGDGVSYAFAADPKGAGYLWNERAPKYPDAERDSMLIPLAYSSFLGTYWGQLPELAPGKSYSFAGYLAVGGGDVASAQKVIYDLKQKPVGRISGTVREQSTGDQVDDITVVFQNDKGHYLSSTRTRDGGRYVAWVPPGTYRLIAFDDTRAPVFHQDVRVEAGGTANADLEIPRPAFLSVTVTDDQGRALPAKISVEAIHDAPEKAGPPWTFLYNLRFGEERRATDFLPDNANDPDTRRYLETSFFIRNGRGGKALRPGKYKVYASRGIEYDLAVHEVELGAGVETKVSLKLKHVLPTPGYASGDFHVHSAHSVDSSMALDQRVLSFAAEGVDYIASTDHNFVTNLKPVVDGQDLTDWLATSVGLELTTLEMGHFNAWPIKYQPGPVTHGAFNWFRRAPADLFANIRSMGALGPERTIVQVNHPRDTIMGYFNAFNVSAYDLRALPPTNAFSLDQSPRKEETKSPYHRDNFSLDFDAVEVFNGKHHELLKHYRIPANPPPGAEPTVQLPAVGEILEERVPVVENADPENPEHWTLNPAFPGALEEWYTMLKQGRRVAGLGNSDSHSSEDEAGLPRTYLRMGASADGSMRHFDEAAAIDAIKRQELIVTNGPFVELWVNDQPVGGSIVAPDGKVSVRVKVQAAPWVDVTKVVILRGGKDQQKVPFVAKEFAVPLSTELVRLEQTFELTDIPDGSFILAEVSGERSMWPVYTPNEVPSIDVSEAVGAIGSTFGYTDKYGRYKPERAQFVVPFAFTNPIWVDRTVKQALELEKPVQVKPLGPTPGEDWEPRRIPDLRRLLGSIHGH